jgi:hypothetical protein
MLPLIGFTGVLLCLTGVLVLGRDLADYLHQGFLADAHFHMTTVLELMYGWTPDA